MPGKTNDKSGAGQRRVHALVRFILRWLFKLTPAKWICEGCCNNGKYGLRNKFGCWVTETYGSWDDGYEGDGLAYGNGDGEII